MIKEPYNLLRQIMQCRDTVIRGLHSNDNGLVCNGVDGLAVLLGQAVLSLSGKENSSWYEQGMRVILDARKTMQEGEKYIRVHTCYTVDHTKPSEWVSFDGEIKTPLYTATSSIPNAGRGLYSSVAIKEGQVIAPNRIKIQDSGDLLLDWRKFPVAAMVNHSPLPNITIVRGERPVGLTHIDPNGSETSYLVANQDIPADTELVSDYRDKGWVEWDYYDHLDLPFDEWDRNVLQDLPHGSKLQEVVTSQPTQFTPSVELLMGSVLCVVSSRSTGWVSALSGVTGVALASHSLWDKMKNGK